MRNLIVKQKKGWEGLMRKQRGVATSVILAAIAGAMMILSYFAGQRSGGGSGKIFPFSVVELFMILITLLIITVVLKNIKDIKKLFFDNAGSKSGK